MKHISFLLLIGMGGIGAFSACKQENKAAVPTATTTEQAATIPASPKPEAWLYMVKVDKLNLREQPNKNGAVILQFAEGDIVEGNGDVSENKEEIELRGIPYNEPYVKITSAGKEGWAYSAALLPVYAGPKNTLPDLNPLKQFAGYLKTLDVKKMDSGSKAMAYATQHLGNAQGTLADAAFILLEQFLFRMETEGDYYQLTEKHAWQDQDYKAVDDGAFDTKKYPLTQKLAENGFRLASGEGMIFPVVNWSMLADKFLQRLTPPMKAYVEQSIADQKEKMWEDGGIIGPLEHLVDRTIKWEKFNALYGNFVRAEETRHLERFLINSVCFGDNNTPSLDYDSGKLTPEFQKAWVYAHEQYAGSNLSKQIKAFSDLLAAEGGKRTPKVEAFMAEAWEE